MNGCLFCKLAAGDVPAEKVYEDQHSLAFLDISPVNHGHTLVIPKEHSADLLDMRKETLDHVMETIQKVALALKRTGAEGINIISNNGAAAGQVVPHTHIHIIPRFGDDDLAHWQGKSYSTGEMQTIAEKIRHAL